MRVLIDPPMNQWRPRRPPRDARHELASRGIVSAAGSPLIATGHQPWLWHPGILAKDLAAAEAARLTRGSWFHLVVDQDALDPYKLEVPLNRDGVLVVESLPG